jgi:NTP pyrophosphatase (non-canonical NTP hydrolase)
MEWNDLDNLKSRLHDFAEKRDWDQFHSPKNLVMALAAEAGELLEHFQWLTEQQSAELDAARLKKVAEEIADIQIYLARLTDRLGISIADAVDEKLADNERKYRSMSGANANIYENFRPLSGIPRINGL